MAGQDEAPASWRSPKGKSRGVQSLEMEREPEPTGEHVEDGLREGCFIVPPVVVVALVSGLVIAVGVPRPRAPDPLVS